MSRGRKANQGRQSDVESFAGCVKLLERRDDLRASSCLFEAQAMQCSVRVSHMLILPVILLEQLAFLPRGEDG